MYTTVTQLMLKGFCSHECAVENRRNACLKALQPVALRQISLTPGEHSSLSPVVQKICPLTLKHLSRSDPWARGVLLQLTNKLLICQACSDTAGSQPRASLKAQDAELFPTSVLHAHSSIKFLTLLLALCTIFGQLWLEGLSVWLHYLQKGSMGLPPTDKKTTDHH